MPAIHTPGPTQVSPDPGWQLPAVQHSPFAGVPLCGEGFSSSSSQCNISDHGPRVTPLQEQIFNRQHKEHFGELRETHRSSTVHNDSTRALEFFINRPTEPTFSQERNNLHANEVSVLMGVTKNCPKQLAAIHLDWMSVKQTCFTLSLRSYCSSILLQQRYILVTFFDYFSLNPKPFWSHLLKTVPLISALWMQIHAIILQRSTGQKHTFIGDWTDLKPHHCFTSLQFCTKVHKWQNQLQTPLKFEIPPVQL